MNNNNEQQQQHHQSWSNIDYWKFNSIMQNVGEGLTSTEVGNFNTCIQTFQTTLGRNV
jgi:hypothetical protein